MKLKFSIILFLNLFIISNLFAHYPSSTFTPRQLSYNPILENSLTLAAIQAKKADHYCFAIKPIYTQNIGSKFNHYFNIDQKSFMPVQEDGSGNIDSLWFQDISSNSTYYASNLAFAPKRKTYGGLFFLELSLPNNFSLSFNSALVTAKNNLHIQETQISNLGTDAYMTVTQSLATNNRLYGKAVNSTKTGLDDIQVKLNKNIYEHYNSALDIYALLGIPTGKGTKSATMFEALIGSKHVQLGFGANYFKEIYVCHQGTRIDFLSELKYRYAFSSTEKRLFDLKQNGQWSRYMLLANQSDRYTTFFASDLLALPAKVTPRSSLDIYLALNAHHENWEFELGYDFWFRNSERISLKTTDFASNVGVADLVGIANLSPTSASKANISQSVVAGNNQMPSDPAFIAITTADINLNSAAMRQSISNSIYASLAYNCKFYNRLMQIGLNLAYERGTNVNTADNITTWANFNFMF